MTPKKDETAGGRGGNGDGLPGPTVDACDEGVLGSITARQRLNALSAERMRRLPILRLTIESSKRPTVVVGPGLLGKSRVLYYEVLIIYKYGE